MKTKNPAREIWALGDYHRFAKELFWSLGPVLVEACGIAPGQRVLDVGAGTGNVAIRAAQAGADVVALDITPESLAAGRREAESLGVELDWVEGDAQELPFGDDEFDVVTSSAGAMFAPDHQAVADELLRVCRPGGTIGMIAFVAEGVSGAFFELLGRFMPPPPPGALPPILWGDEDHVRELFGDRVASLDLTHRQYVEKLSSEPATPQDYVDFYKADLRAGRRDLRRARRPARPGCGARSRAPRPRDPLEPRHARGGRVPLRLPADRRSAALVLNLPTRLDLRRSNEGGLADECSRHHNLRDRDHHRRRSGAPSIRQRSEELISRRPRSGAPRA